MSDASLQIDVGPALELLNRHQHAFKSGSRRGVLTMSRAIARSASATTKVSPRTRTIVKSHPTFGTDEGVFYAKRPRSNGRFAYLQIIANDKGQARTDKKAQIINRGLAKQAWFWVTADVGGGSKNVAGASKRKSKKYYDVKDHHKRTNPAIMLHNKLGYATHAFKIKGEKTITTSQTVLPEDG